ncbi:MAG: hypothetical protein ACOC25_01515 [Alkalispirochaetaceae bacterium]
MIEKFHVSRPAFMEVNPLSGLHPEHSDLPIICNLRGIPYVDLIRQIVDSALARVDGAEKEKEEAKENA